MSQSDSPQYKNAIHYLINRNITKYDIYKYNLHYCWRGKFANRIIFPSYDAVGMLNFYVGRSYSDSKLKYLMPALHKDIIFNELFINWKQPIVLCEGVTDMLAIQTNAIPLMGKFIQNKLLTSIVTNKPPQVFVVLDSDAYNDSIQIAKTLANLSINTYVTQLPIGSDPGQLGNKKVWQYINQSQQFNKKFLMKNIFKR